MNFDDTLIERVVYPSDLTSVSHVETLVDKVCNELAVDEEIYGNILKGTNYTIYLYLHCKLL